MAMCDYANSGEVLLVIMVMMGIRLNVRNKLIPPLPTLRTLTIISMITSEFISIITN